MTLPTIIKVTLPARFSLATLGVRDVRRSTEFYLALGWPLSRAWIPGEGRFFDTDGGILAIWGYDELARDAGVSTQPSGDTGDRGVSYPMHPDIPAAVNQ